MTERTDRAVRWALFAVVAVGIAVRLTVYLYNRSLWLDEVNLALSVVERSYGGLLQRLDYNLVSPPFLGLAAKFIYGLWGSLEHSMRLVPLLAGCLCVCVFARVVTKAVPGLLGALGASLYALGVLHVNWGTSFKHYVLDQLGTALILYVAVLWEGLSETKRYVLSAVLPALMWLSYTSVFVLFGFGLVIGLSALKGRTRQSYSACVVFLISFCVAGCSLFEATVKHSLGHGQMMLLWKEAFPSSPVVSWLGKRLLEVFGTAVGMPDVPGLVLFLSLIGAVWFLKSGHQPISVLSAGTLAAALLTCFLGGYPFAAGRASAYLSPIVILLLTGGLHALYASTRVLALRRCAAAAAIAICLVNFSGLVALSPRLLVKEEMRYVVRALEERSDVHTPILVSAFARNPFRLYGTAILGRGVPPVAYLQDRELDTHDLDMAWLAAGKPDKFWLVLTNADFERAEQFLDLIKPFGHVEDAIRKGWSGAYLIEAVQNGASSVHDASFDAQPLEETD